MGIQLSLYVENIVGKGEIARYEQFLLFPQCFLLKQTVVDVLKNEYLRVWLKMKIIQINTIYKCTFSCKSAGLIICGTFHAG